MAHVNLYDNYEGKWNWKYFSSDPASMKLRAVAQCVAPFEIREDCERAIEWIVIIRAALSLYRTRSDEKTVPHPGLGFDTAANTAEELLIRIL